jgi:hypothetical protein
LSVWAVGRWLGKRYLFGAVGIRDGQAKMLARCGGQTAPAIAPIFVEEYDDEVSVMYFDLHHPPPGVAAQLETVERRLLPLNPSTAGAADQRRVPHARVLQDQLAQSMRTRASPSPSFWRG